MTKSGIFHPFFAKIDKCVGWNKNAKGGLFLQKEERCIHVCTTKLETTTSTEYSIQEIVIGAE